MLVSEHVIQPNEAVTLWQYSYQNDHLIWIPMHYSRSLQVDCYFLIEIGPLGLSL